MHQALKLTKMKVSTTIATRLFNTNPHPLLRHISTASAAATATATTTAKTTNAALKHYIMKNIYKVGSAGGKVSDVLHSIRETDQRVTANTLFDCFKELRRNGRYQQCLEIIDWFEKDKFAIPERNFTLRIGILHKLKGLAEAEKYFDSIPSVSKNSYVYGSLLSCYCTDLKTDKALATFKTMDKMGFASNVVVFNNILNLYVKTKQLKKIPKLISEMKKKQLPLNSHTYCLLFQSYRLVGDLEGLERVFHEAQENSFVKDDWLIYSNVASVFIELGQFEKASSCLQKLENVLNCSDDPSRDAFHSLISLYAGAGKLDSVIHSWNTLKSKCNVNKQSYLALLQALSRLDDIEGLENYFREWESTCKYYDDTVPAVLIRAYLRHDMLEEAELLLKDATEKIEKSGNVLRFPHVIFMNYYFGKGDTESALKYMEAALVLKWKPIARKLDPCFQHFKDRKDVDGLEKFCELLKRAEAWDREAFSLLLKTMFDTRQWITEDGINVAPRLTKLFHRFLP